MSDRKRTEIRERERASVRERQNYRETYTVMELEWAVASAPGGTITDGTHTCPTDVIRCSENRI